MTPAGTQTNDPPDQTALLSAANLLSFGGMTVPEAKRLKELETENTRLKKLLAESMLEIEVTREALRKKW